jgi:predicted DNA-binding WGR domain protein
MADNTYQVEYSTTDRAACKDTKCKQKIGKGVLRIGKEAPSPFGDGTVLNWYHASCAFRALTRAKSGTKKIDDMDDLVGHEALSSADKKLISRMIDGETLWSESGWKASASKTVSETKEAPSKKRKIAETPKSPKKAKSSSGGKTYLEFFGSKFWEIQVHGASTGIRFGKVGCAGTSQMKPWGSHDMAVKQMEKQIKAKKRSGYKEVGEESSGGEEEEGSGSEEEEEDSDSSSSDSSSSEEEEDDEDDWQWQDEDDKWHSYWPVQQKGIKAAIKEKRLFYKFVWKSNNYRVHLKLLYQINTSTNAKRKVRVK